MDDRSEEARRLSAAVFGNRHFSAVVLAISERARKDADLVTTRELARAADVSDSTVRPVLLRLTDAGLLHALPKAGHARATQYYEPVSGPVWEALVKTAQALGLGDAEGPTPPATAPLPAHGRSARGREA